MPVVRRYEKQASVQMTSEMFDYIRGRGQDERVSDAEITRQLLEAGRIVHDTAHAGGWDVSAVLERVESLAPKASTGV